MGALRTSLWIHPTDAQEEGAARALAEAREMGVRALNAATTYHAGRFLLPHAAKQVVRMLEDGVAYYAPDPARWEEQRLRPKLAEVCREVDLWRELRDAARTAGLATNAWLVALHNSRLGEAHPDCTIRNAFGDRYVHALCPSHPDARLYAVTLASEVAERLEPQALALEAFGFMGYAHQSHHDKRAVELDGAHDFLLSICFCESCARRMKSREVAAERMAERVRALLRACFDAGRPESRLEKPEEIGPWLAKRLGAAEFAGLLAARKESVVSLVEEIRRRVPRRVELHAMAHASPFVTGAAIGGGLQALGDVTDAFVLNLFEADVERLRAQVRSARSAAAPGARFVASLRAFAPDSGDESQFLAKIRMLREERIEEVAVYHYGLMPRAHFAWIRRAAST